MDFVDRGGAARDLRHDGPRAARSRRGAQGETVLVLGASGGIGIASIEIAKALGGARHRRARRVTTSLRSAARTAPTPSINYATDDLRERIKTFTDGRGVDVIVDPVGGPYTEPALRSIAWRGRLLVVGFAAGEIPKIPLNLALLKGCSIVGVFWGEFLRREPGAFREERRAARRVVPREGKITRTSRRPSLSITPSTRCKLMAARKVVGKVVITM